MQVLTHLHNKSIVQQNEVSKTDKYKITFRHYILQDFTIQLKT